MPSDDLSSIQGLEDKHLRALARQHVTDLRGLVHADRRVVYRAMGNLRPRPTLEQISRWQDDARSKLEETVTDASAWHTAASFVVVFSQRQVGGTWERRVEAERTEVEPERNLQVWSGWDCAPICGWMLGQPDLVESAAAPPSPAQAAAVQAAAVQAVAVPTAAVPAAAVQAAAVQAPAVPAAAVPAAAVPAVAVPAALAQAAAVQAGGRAQLRIDSAAIIDATGRTDVVTAGALVPNPPTDLVAPVRVVLTVGGAQPGTQLQAVTRILRPDGPGWNPQDPVVLPGSGQAEFDLSAVPAGEHEMSLIAWAPDATATLVSVSLPRVTIRSGSSVRPQD
jgi:hypothetical protein